MKVKLIQGRAERICITTRVPMGTARQYKLGIERANKQGLLPGSSSGCAWPSLRKMQLASKFRHACLRNDNGTLGQVSLHSSRRAS